MGRHPKVVLDQTGNDRRGPGYYSTPGFIADFITATMLEINPSGHSVLDPCVGREEMCDAFHRAGKSIDSMDIVDYGGYSKSNYLQADFIKLFADHCSGNKTGEHMPALDYDYYIANPPYNCHEGDYIARNKPVLENLFGGIGVLNMYAMFLSALIDCAREKALIGLIVHDSFLTARMHAPLRKKILDKCAIHYLILCSTDLFLNQKAEVRTCIMILEKTTRLQCTVKTLNRPLNQSLLKQHLEAGDFKETRQDQLALSTSLNCNQFVIDCPPAVRSLFDCPRLGDAARCLTGISTGNDKKFLSRSRDEYFSVPFYKNPGTRRFHSEPDGFLPGAFLEISHSTPTFIVRNKDYLFREGITCSSMGVAFGACYLPPGSTFGVNTGIFCDEHMLWWLLAYLNSSLATYFIRGVLIRTNMVTSGYIANVPLLPFGAFAREQMGQLAQEAWAMSREHGANADSTAVASIDEIVFAEAGLNTSDRSFIRDFCLNIVRRT